MPIAVLVAQPGAQLAMIVAVELDDVLLGDHPFAA
jgi:hypothetical protein